MKRELYPPDSKSHRSEIEVWANWVFILNSKLEILQWIYIYVQATIIAMRAKNDKKLMDQLEEMERNKNKE